MICVAEDFLVPGGILVDFNSLCLPNEKRWELSGKVAGNCPFPLFVLYQKFYNTEYDSRNLCTQFSSLLKQHARVIQFNCKLATQEKLVEVSSRTSSGSLGSF